MEKTDVSADTRRFRFALPSKRTKLGLPVGNHMQVFAEVDGETVLRSYTPVSGVDERGYFDMVIKIYGKCDKFPAGGKMSQHLDSLSVGDKIDVRGPMGKFEYLGKGRFTVDGVSRSADKIGLIAGGTGITPAYQVIKAILGDANDSTKVSLLFANQTPEDVLLRSDLDKLAKDFPDRFQLHYTVDRASGDWKGSTGFVDEAMIKAHMPAPGDGTFIAACGPPVMLEKAVFPALDSVGYKADDYMSF
uniref:NADH-cytochrome b5 reductase n=2 Tax=Hemiselmis andersenii TaxID=464988 RepID=A0A7S1DR16_HEMAN|mmetsp:Transcript_2267/g.5271  ORF Transcript_2267/g.5271 Transcript_2267/m.5271 type:complete len:247 (+) Transcript_2267:105-845(+)